MLELTTSVKREVIKVDGKPYELKDPSEFSVTDYTWLSGQGNRIAELSEKKNPTTADANEIKVRIDNVLKKIFIAPFWVRNKLSYEQKTQIVSFFAQKVTATTERIRQQTKDTSLSHDFSDSMEGPSRIGS